MRTKLLLFVLLLIGLISTLAFAQPAYSTASPVSTANPLFTPAPSQPVDQTAPSGPPLSLTLSLLCFCLVLLLIFGVFVLGVVTRNQNYKHDKEHEL